MIRLFAQADVSTMVCTTTLIEGVNTSAKNVILLDKKIDRERIDHFTFSNLRGRAGRMASHYFGRVITYMPPPDVELTEVDMSAFQVRSGADPQSVLGWLHATQGHRRRVAPSGQEAYRVLG